jgi:biopolymer transport protein ExbD
MRHHHGHPHEDHTKPTLPITAFLDFSFQLLAFFIITFKPSTTEGQLALMLPKGGADNQTVAAAPPDTLTAEPEELYVVRVQADRSGNPEWMELVVPKVADAIRFEDPKAGDDKPADPRPKETRLLDALKTRLDEKKTAKEPPPKLEYQFAEKLNYQYVIKLLDDAKQAGFEKISPTLLLVDKPKPVAK